jgi:HD-GYP domain-containing protein (c-di-GMP phosphodiesterase class II)
MTQMRPERLEREMIRIGKTLVSQFFVLLKTAQNYEEGHSALNAPISNIMKTVREIHRRNEEASIRVKGGYLLLGELRLKPDAAGFEAFMFTMGEMKRYFIGCINFTPSVKAEEIGSLAYVFREVEPIPSPQTFQKFLDHMRQRNIVGIEMESLAEEEQFGEADTAELKDSRVRAKKVYMQTIHAVSEVMDNAKMGQTLRLRKSKRVVQGMIDQLLTAETNLIGLTTIRSHDEYTYNHSVNVCILSLGIGQRVGLSKPKLCELGMAALFHDIGKAEIPLEILNKPTEFTKEEWEAMQRHPVHGVRKLMRLKGLDALSARIITGAFEHHLNYDLSGYPKVPYKSLSLFGRIISIADCYDGLTSSRVYSRVPYPPEKALRFMMQRAGKAYDSVLLKLFINCIGIYPVGTLLLLNTKELAVVMQNNPDQGKWNSPKVKVISDPDGNEIDGETIDLSDPRNGRAILEALDPQQYKIDVSRYFI